jgi:nucleoid-associated protein YgaU
LPFGLTDEAKSRLVAIRSDASSRISLNTTKFVDHVVKRGETLQSISIRYFGNPDYYLDIYLANRTKLRNPVDVREGTFLRIPVYE